MSAVRTDITQSSTGRGRVETAEIRVAVGDPSGRHISTDLWGLFLEDINYAVDGGLNADLVRNGDFEATVADHAEWGPLTGWHVEPGADGQVQVRSDAPLSSANATYVRLVPGSDGVRLVNSGYGEDGMACRVPVHRLRLAVRAPQGPAHLRATLMPGGAEEPDAWIGFDVETDGWSWVDVDLPRGGQTRARLVLEVTGDRAVDVDCVSLRPRDPHTGEVQLFRPDLVQALRELKPSFVRFPGGCLAHGYGLDNMYHWKSTIGPRHERRAMPNVWGYHQSMAIGYFEYFLLCEQLGASPLPVVAAGVCCQNTPGGPQAIPPERMPQYVQDVLDLVEFANGGPGTRWGAVRAELGHPEPFGMRYLGIGNEDEITPDFETRFAQLHDAVVTEHPEVCVIGTVGPSPFGRDFDAGWELARRLDVAMVDEHMYRSPRWLLQNVDRYDSYDRHGPAVYLGEWAAKTSTVRSAIAEAACMVGVERNGDVVRLASYAPLLARVGATQWVPDLVYFTDDEVRPSASYHVQQMFSQLRGVAVCPVEVSGGASAPQPAPGLAWAGVRSPGSQVSFTDLTVDGTPLADAVSAAQGSIAELALAEGATELSFTATRTSGEEGFQLVFGDRETGTTYGLNVGGWRNKMLVLERVDDGIGNEIDGPLPFTGVRTGEPLTVRVRVEAPWIRVWVDERLVHDVRDDLRPAPQVFAGASTVADGGDDERVLRLVNASDAPVRARLTISGRPGDVVGQGRLLAGVDPAAGASFEASPVPPVPSDVHGSVLELPPWSVWSGTIAGSVER